MVRCVWVWSYKLVVVSVVVVVVISHYVKIFHGGACDVVLEPVMHPRGRRLN